MLACLSLDADDLWSYLKTHGNPAWVDRPSYLPMFVPRMLSLLDDLGITITFFLVGSDADRPENRAAMAAITASGHEVGNHSYEHDPWLHLFEHDQIDADLARAEAAILAATGQRPIGFRGPGFSWSPVLLNVLHDRGYRYDGSTLPTFLNPIARWYFLSRSTLTGEARAQRAALFGTWRDGFRPAGPYLWKLAPGRRLLEIPTTTIPGLKVPFHLSYLLYLRRRSLSLMRGYLKGAILACKAAGIGPSFLLHPLDILGGDEVPALGFFPGMDLTSAQKRATVTEVLTTLGDHFDLVPMGAFAEQLSTSRLDAIAPRWDAPAPGYAVPRASHGTISAVARQPQRKP